MDILDNWLQFVGVILTLILGFIGIGVYIKKVALKDLKDYKKTQENSWDHQADLCVKRGEEIKEMKSTTRITLECHDVTLKALENISKGLEINGEIEEQRRKLKNHMLNKFSKED
jgi:membrane carboxypeptidase/penicillin-binding protein